MKEIDIVCGDHKRIMTFSGWIELGIHGIRTKYKILASYVTDNIMFKCTGPSVLLETAWVVISC